MGNDVVVWRIVDWDGRYESSRSLKKTGRLATVTVSADLGRVVLRRLLERPDSAEILGVWYYLQMLAAQGDRRGVLSSLGAPLTPEDLAKLSGFDVSLIERVLGVLGSPEVRLMEQVPLDTALQSPVIEPPRPRKPRPRAFARCPKCDADLVQLAESGEFEHLLMPEAEAACDGGDCACGIHHAGHAETKATLSTASAEQASQMRHGVAFRSAKGRAFAERKTTLVDHPVLGQPYGRCTQNSDAAGAIPSKSHDLGNASVEAPAVRCDSQPPATLATHSAESHKPRSGAAYRKNRKAARQAKKKARRIEARRG